VIRLAKPVISETAIQEVASVLRSGNLVQGKYVKKLEDMLQNYFNVPYVVVVSSGTAALHLSLIAAGVGPGDEVIVPAFTFPATVNAVEIVGATPVLVDIGLDDCCIDVSKIEDNINSKTKAIIPVHEFGQSAEIDKINKICERRNLTLIEDAACALGTSFKGKMAGTWGHYGCFSLHPRKAITTGEGGFIIVDNQQGYDKLRSLRNHGIQKTNKAIDFVLPGFNYRMTEFQAVLGIQQLAIIDEIIKTRRNQARKYDSIFKDWNGIITPKIFNNRLNVYQSYHIFLPNNKNRRHIVNKLFGQGIEVNIGAYAIQYLTYYKNKYDYKLISFSNSRDAYKHGLVLPLGGHIDQSTIETISNKIIQAL